jgi:hypothetical protein
MLEHASSSMVNIWSLMLHHVVLKLHTKYWKVSSSGGCFINYPKFKISARWLDVKDCYLCSTLWKYHKLLILTINSQTLLYIKDCDFFTSIFLIIIKK